MMAPPSSAAFSVQVTRTLPPPASCDALLSSSSRSALASVRAAFPDLVVVNVTARADVLAKRLAARGRETAKQIEARLARTTAPLPLDLTIMTIDNSGDLEVAGKELVQLIEELLQSG